MAFFSTALIVGGGLLAAKGLSDMEDAEDAAHGAMQEQTQAARDAAQSQRDRFALEQKQSEIQNDRMVRQSVRQARIARAAIINTGANTGTSGSSGVVGGASSVQSQLGSELGFFGEMRGLNNDIITTQIAEAGARERMGIAQGRLALAQQKSNAAGQQFNLGTTIFGAGGGWRSIFSTGTPKT